MGFLSSLFAPPTKEDLNRNIANNQERIARLQSEIERLKGIIAQDKAHNRAGWSTKINYSSLESTVASKKSEIAKLRAEIAHFRSQKASLK